MGLNALRAARRGRGQGVSRHQGNMLLASGTLSLLSAAACVICKPPNPQQQLASSAAACTPVQFQLRPAHLRIKVHAPGAAHVHHGRLNRVAGGQVGHADAPPTLVRCSQGTRGWVCRRVASELVPCADWGSVAGSVACMARLYVTETKACNSWNATKPAISCTIYHTNH